MRLPTTSMRWTCAKICYVVFTHMVLKNRRLFNSVQSSPVSKVIQFYLIIVLFIVICCFTVSSNLN